MMVVKLMADASPLDELAPAAPAELPEGDFWRKCSSSFSIIRYSFSNSLFDIELSRSACIVL